MSEVLETFPELHIQRLKLVETGVQYLRDLFLLFTDRDVTRYYHVIPIVKEDDLLPMLSLFRNRFETKSGIRWAIILADTGEFIGTAGYNNLVIGHKGSLVYALRSSFQGKGYASEALAKIIHFGKTELGLTRIDAEVMPGNIASEKLLLKLGFTHEGLLHDWVSWQGDFFDVNVYSRVEGVS